MKKPSKKSCSHPWNSLPTEELKLDPNACTIEGITVAGCVKSPEHLNVLLDFKADIHMAAEPLGMTPLSRVACMADIETTLTMLRLL